VTIRYDLSSWSALPAAQRRTRKERAFYDSHRASLVPEQDAEEVFEDIKRGAAPSRARDRGLTVRHLAPFFHPSVWKGFDDGPDVGAPSHRLAAPDRVQGFFTIYGNLFARLAAEEAQFADTAYPAFGRADAPWAPPSKADADGAARTFYAAWTNFASEKDFAWMEMWNLAEAPDRRVRRSVVRCCGVWRLMGGAG
jgi:DnaJ family protein A protein 5